MNIGIYSLWIKKVIRKFFHDRCLVDASALSYVTILSLVPIIVITFSFFSAFATLATVKEKLLGYLLKFMLPGSATAVMEYVTKFSAKSKTLGIWGVIALIFLAFSLFSSTEESFNRIWGIHRNRPLPNRLFIFTNILFWLPLLLGLSFYMSTKIALVPYLGIFSKIYLSLLPLFISLLAFTFSYLVIPAVRVKLKAAFVGGVLSALLWELAKHLFDFFVAKSFSFQAFTVLYGPLVVLPVFLVWVYLCWIITLLGAEVTFFSHHGIRVDVGKGACLAGFVVTTAVLCRLAKKFEEGGGGAPEDELVGNGVSISALRGVMGALEKKGLVASSEKGYFLLVPPDKIELGRLLDILLPEEESLMEESVNAIAEKIKSSLNGVTLAHLLKEDVQTVSPETQR